MSEVIPLTEYQIRCCKDSIEYWTGLTCTRDQLLDIISMEPELIEILHEWYTGEIIDEKEHYGLDTADRDILFDAIAKHVGVEHWPLNMEIGTEHERLFYQKMDEAIEHGWLQRIEDGE